MKVMLFVMNPNAGTKKANRYLTDILALFNQYYTVITYMTKNAGDATRAVAYYAPKVDLIVCCGGDGTFNETINGLMQCGAPTPIGYIPSGSTNDFASSLNLPLDPLQAARAIMRGTPVSYDIGKFCDRYFSYVASFGAFTRTSYATPQSIKNMLGHTAYILGGIQELSQVRPIHMKLELDNEVIEDDFIFGAISNSTSVGGILTLDPNQVDMRDGKFEIMLVRAPQKLGEIAACIQAVQSQNYNNCQMITFCSSSTAQITTDPALVWTLDGERADGSGFIRVQNCHQAIQLIQRG